MKAEPAPRLLGEGDLDAVCDLCVRALPDPPAKDELARALFSGDEVVRVLGDPSVGIVATIRSGTNGFVRIIAVEPALQGQGHGMVLLSQAEEDLAAGGAKSVQVGADAPYFLYPGVESTNTAMLCLLERRKYNRNEANFNMGVDLDRVPPDPGGHQLATAGERNEVAGWMDANWSNWTAETLRALDNSTLAIARDERGEIAAVCAYDVNRRGFLGPIAVRADLYGKGAGRDLLVGALHRMKGAGRSYAEVVWVGPIYPYARVGAHVSRVFFVYRKNL